MILVIGGIDLDIGVLLRNKRPQGQSINQQAPVGVEPRAVYRDDERDQSGNPSA